MKNPTKKQITEFLTESNMIEGVYDTDSLLQAQYAWDYLMEQEEMSPHVVLHTHKILMLHQKLRPDEKGYYRKCPVWIGGREGILWQRVPDAMKKWVGRMNSIWHIRSIVGREAYAKFYHVEFEKIHPFVDGNGRTGRMFMNWHRIKRLGLPLLTIYDKDKYDYYDWFK